MAPITLNEHGAVTIGIPRKHVRFLDVWAGEWESLPAPVSCGQQVVLCFSVFGSLLKFRAEAARNQLGCVHAGVLSRACLQVTLHTALH